MSRKPHTDVRYCSLGATIVTGEDEAEDENEQEESREASS